MEDLTTEAPFIDKTSSAKRKTLASSDEALQPSCRLKITPPTSKFSKANFVKTSRTSSSSKDSKSSSGKTDSKHSVNKKR